MKKKFLIIIGIAIAVLAIGALIYAAITIHKTQNDDSKYLKEISYTELEKKIEAKDDFILVFSRTTCSHCAEFKPVLASTLAEYKITAYVVELDELTDAENAKLKDIANVSGTPTTIFMQKGEETTTASRLVGSNHSKEDIVKKLKAFGYINE